MVDDCFDDPYVLMATAMLRRAVSDMAGDSPRWGRDALRFIRGEEGQNYIRLLGLAESIEFNKIMVSVIREFRSKYDRCQREA